MRGVVRKTCCGGHGAGVHSLSGAWEGGREGRRSLCHSTDEELSSTNVESNGDLETDTSGTEEWQCDCKVREQCESAQEW